MRRNDRYRWKRRWTSVLMAACLLAAGSTELAAQEVDPWEVTGVRNSETMASKILFSGGDTLGTGLYEVRVLGRLQSLHTSSPPYLVLTGMRCTECDAPVWLFVHPLGWRDLRGGLEQPRFLPPGETWDDMEGRKPRQVRLWMGNCVAAEAELVWEISDLETEATTYDWVVPTPTGLDIRSVSPHASIRESVEEHVRRGTCREVDPWGEE